MLIFKICMIPVMIYGGIRMCKIALHWIREGFNQLEPTKHKRKDEFEDVDFKFDDDIF